MKYPFRFKVQNFDRNDNEGKYYITNGMGVCTSYSDAAEQIETYFGDELCSILNITLFQEDNLIFLSEETCDEYSKTCFPSIEYSYECTPEGEKII